MSFIKELGGFGEDVFDYLGDTFQASATSKMANADYNAAIAERISVNNQLAVQGQKAEQDRKNKQQKFIQTFAFSALGIIAFFYLVSLVLKYKK